MNGPQHAEAIGKGIEIACAKTTVGFEARNLRNPKAGLRDPNIDQGLHLEADSPLHDLVVQGIGIARIQCHDLEALTSEGVVAVAEVRVSSSVEHIHNLVEPEVPESTDNTDVEASPSRQESRSLGEVGTFLQGAHEIGDLAGVVGSVRIDHDDEISRRRSKAACKRASLSSPGLADDGDIRPQTTRLAHRGVG